MSRLAKKPIPLPKGVELTTSGKGKVGCKGPKGTLELELPEGLLVRSEEQEVFLDQDEKKLSKYPLYGLYRSLLKNMIVGVSEGFEVVLEMVGVGYRSALQGENLDLQVGFSHPTAMAIPSGIKVALEDKGTVIKLQGSDKQQVTQFAADIRAMRPPEPYKGKGIRYRGEHVRKKEGKAAKGKAG